MNFLCKKKLSLSDLSSGNYIDILDSKEYYTATPIKIKRQRVNDNLLGFAHFCPFVRRTPTLATFENKQLDRIAKKLLANYEPFIIQRAASYLYLKETLSSWHIEHEEPSRSRAVNFAKLLGKTETIETLTKKRKLIQAQHAIVESGFPDPIIEAAKTILAKWPEHIIPWFDICPAAPDVPSLMHDYCITERMIASNLNPVVIAATISFGFVFIHPFEDGNGRLHRFLIHYILSRISFTPPGIIFPISAIMLSNRKKYDQVLESFSRPLWRSSNMR